MGILSMLKGGKRPKGSKYAPGGQILHADPVKLADEINENLSQITKKTAVLLPNDSFVRSPMLLCCIIMQGFLAWAMQDLSYRAEAEKKKSQHLKAEENKDAKGSTDHPEEPAAS